jgi:carbon storage regulator
LIRGTNHLAPAAHVACIGERSRPWEFNRRCIMLVLSRQRDESIIIGDNVIVTIVDVRGDRVRLGIEAPREVSVHRREVYDAIQRENQQAAQIRPDQARRIADGPADAR